MNKNKKSTTKNDFVTVRINAELLDALRAQAHKEERTLAGQIIFYVKQGLSGDAK